jgi:DNA-binding NarL/FixJ family response regulator
VSHAIRVLCVDDHAVLVQGLKAQFAMNSGIELVGRLSSANGLVAEVSRLRPHIVIMDIEMPGADAFEMADRLRQAHPGVRMMVLSGHIRDSYISASYRAGASAYFAKSDELEDIVNGIHEVMGSGAGGFVLGPRVRERCGPQSVVESPSTSPSRTIPPHGEPPPPTLLQSLTGRELEILRLIGKGLGRVEIAAQLCRSVKTIDAHQDRMMRKLSITGRADLMRFAIREGLAQA